MPDTMIQIQSLPHIHQLEAYEKVELPMTSEDRQRVRRRLKSPDGKILALALATGTTLHVGQVLHLEDDKAYVVAAAPEDVLVISPSSLQEAAFVGHLIGNLHRDIDIQGNDILALWNLPLERRLQKEGLSAIRTKRPFKGDPPGEHSH